MRLSCLKIKRLMSEYSGGGFMPTPYEFEQHLGNCPGCAADFDALKKLHNLLKDRPKYSAPAGFSNRVMRQIRESKEVARAPLPGFNAFRIFAQAAAIILVVAIGIVSGASLASNMANVHAGGVNQFEYAQDSFDYNQTDLAEKDYLIAAED